MSENKKEIAREVFDTLCQALESFNYRYQKNEDELVVKFGVIGDDLPMNFIVKIDDERELVSLFSALPVRFKNDKRVEGSIATNAVNYLLADGSFDYDLRDGEVTFRMTSSYRDSMIGTEMLKYMIDISIQTVDRYNDKLFLVNQGILDFEDFIKQIND